MQRRKEHGGLSVTPSMPCTLRDRHWEVLLAFEGNNFSFPFRLVSSRRFFPLNPAHVLFITMWCQIIETEVVAKGLFIIPIRCFTLRRPVSVSRWFFVCGNVQLNPCGKAVRSTWPNSSFKREHHHSKNGSSLHSHGWNNMCLPRRGWRKWRGRVARWVPHKADKMCSPIFSISTMDSPLDGFFSGFNGNIYWIWFSRVFADANESSPKYFEIGWIYSQ